MKSYFDSSLNTRVFLRQPVGYKAPSTAAFNQENPSLQLGKSGKETDVTFSTLRDLFPLKIILRACIFPVTLKEKGIQAQAQLRLNGTLYKPQDLYETSHPNIKPQDIAKESQYESVELRYEGMGAVQMPFSTELKFFEGLFSDTLRLNLSHQEAASPSGKGLLIYKKPFAYERSSMVTDSKVETDDGRYFTSPPAKFGVQYVLRAYGGFYHPGCPAKKIQQVYYSIWKNSRETSIDLSLSNTLREENISFLSKVDAFQKGFYFASTPSREQGLNLSSALKEGYASFTASIGEAKETYVSVDYQHATDDAHYIDLFFTPRTPQTHFRDKQL